MKNNTEAQTLAPSHALEIANAAGMNLKTLETRNMDSLDFHDISVGSIQRAIAAAFEAGKEAGKEATKN